ncbi:hypothetical protein GBA63_03360 [Rubrobacter tropicus]|uniref:Ig-like domain-containing protein n=1 Tax=Rubrobacter tropicus TaxID=2653851 RepID=A0A6G8Q5P6_9ACTN|nr:Ig-like domain-containing protein [Rubrobacter tropicus]QIN81780.1 hypothetical protein GBA63_03360 [Rubrobacter tropicus]
MTITNIAFVSRRGAVILVALALAFAFFAGQVWAQETDTTPPTVEAFSPADNGTARPTDNVTVTFSEPMDASSVNTAFTLTRDGAAGPVAASVTPGTGVDTSFTLDPSGDLAQGATYTARIEGAADVAGNALDTDPAADGNQPKVWSFQVSDIEDPAITLDGPGPNTEARDSLRATATATDNVGVDRVEFVIDGTARVQAVRSGDSYSAEIDTSGFAHGSTHTLAAQAFDTGQNASAVSPSPARSFTIDRQVSLSLGNTPAPGGFVTALPAPLSFATDDDVSPANRECRAFRTATTAGAFADCSSPFSPNLAADGAYTYEVRVTDNVGNTDSQTRTFTLDRVDPTLTIDGGPNDGATFGPNTTQSWTFTAGDATSGPPRVECSVIKTGAQEQHVFGPCSGASSHSVSNRGGGQHEFKVRATDGAGHQTTLTRSFSIDATAPAVSLTSPSEGQEARDSVTAAATATDTGGVARVEFLIDGALRATDTTSPYSADLNTAALPHGTTHTVTARAVDAFGNEESASRTFVVDRQVSLTLGASPTAGGFTNAPSVPLSFTTDDDVAAGDRECRATRTGAAQGTFVACASPFSPTLSADGEYTYEVRVTDNVGNVAGASRVFTLDRTSPNLAIGTGPDGGTFGPNTTQTWTFTAGDATSGPATVECSVAAAGGTHAFGACSAAGSHSVTNRPDGSYEFKVKAIDKAGNERVLTRSFTIDATDPTVGISGLDEGQKVGASVTVAATASDNIPGAPRVEFLVDGAVKATDNDAPYSAGLNLAAFAHGSSHTISVRATDGVGNTASASRTVTLDKLVSLTLGASPAAGGFTNAASVPLSFDTDPDVVKRECRATRSGTVAGNFAPCAAPFEPALTQDGVYTYEVRVTDDVGNTKTESRAFTFDRTSPNLALSSGPDGGTFGPNTTQSWTFNAGDATSGPPEVLCSVAAVPPVGAAAHEYGPCGGAGSHSVTNRPDGTYEFSVRAADRAGNQSVVKTRAIRIDATAPTATLTGPATGTKVGKTMTVTFAASDDLTGAPRVEFLVDGTVRAPVPGSRTPNSATLDMQVYDQDSTHTVAVRATDDVGNRSASSGAEVTVDRQVSLALGDSPVQGGQTNAASVPLSFTTDADVSDAGRECQVERRGTPPEPYAPCASPYAPDLTADGVYIYRVRVTDDVGNVATASRAFTFDETPPALTVNGPNDGVFGPGTRQEWTISAGDATTGPARVQCSVAAAGASPNYGPCATSTSHFAANRPEGSYELRVRATDGAGNATEVARTFAIDATPPAVAIDAGLPDNAITNRTSLTWTFSAEAGATFQCRVYAAGSTPPAFGPCSGDGRHTAGPLAQGKYTFEVRGLDTLGNRLDGPSAGRTFTVDTTAPRISGVTPANNARNVAPNANVAATFTEAMRLTTLGKANFKIIRSGTSTPVAASVTFSPVTNRATLNPVNPLRQGATYRVVVTTGARDLANNPLQVTKSWNFRVR